MNSHLTTLAQAQQASVNAQKLQLQTMKWVISPLPHSEKSRITPAQFFTYKESLHHHFSAVNVMNLVNRTVTRDGPDPSPDEHINRANQETFDCCNRLIYSIITRSFNDQNHGHSLVIGIEIDDGISLYHHIVNHFERLQEHERDDTRLRFYTSKQTAGTSARSFIHDLQVQRRSLATIEIEVTDRSFNQVLIKGLIINEELKNLMLLKVHKTCTEFMVDLSRIMDLDEVISLPKSNKRSYEDSQASSTQNSYWTNLDHITCYNCNQQGHYANQCPQRSNEYSYGKGSYNGKGGRGGRGGKGYGGKSSGKGRGGRGSYYQPNYQYGGRGYNPPSYYQPQNSSTVVAASGENESSYVTSYHSSEVTEQNETQPNSADRVDNLVENFFENHNAMISSDQCQQMDSILAYLNTENEEKSTYWLFDTGCGSHLANTLEVYVKPPTAPASDMFTASGERMLATVSGTTKCGFVNVKYTPTCQFCIFSTRQAKQDQWKIELNNEKDVYFVIDPVTNAQFQFINIKGFYFYVDKSNSIQHEPENDEKKDTDTEKLEIRLTHEVRCDEDIIQLYKMKDPDGSNSLCFSLISKTKAVYEFLLWHQRLNHINYNDLKHLITNGALTGFSHNINLIDVKLLPKCKICNLWKMHRVNMPSFNKPHAEYTSPGQYFAVDMKEFSRQFHKNLNAFVVIVDGYSHYRWIYWIKIPTPKYKKEVFLNDIFKAFYYSVCKPNAWLHFILHPDNAKFFTSNELQEFCAANGIILDPSIPYKPRTNGLAETAVHMIVQDGVCNLASAKLPHLVFPYACNTGNQIRNMIPNGPDGKSPEFRLKGDHTPVNSIRTFGCRGYIYDIKANTNKLQSKGNPGRFLQFKIPHFSTVIAYDEVSGRIMETGTGDFIFDETNTQALIQDLDINDELSALKAIEEPQDGLTDNVKEGTVEEYDKDQRPVMNQSDKDDDLTTNESISINNAITGSMDDVPNIEVVSLVI